MTRVHRPGEPAYGRGGTFAQLPLVLDPADLPGADVAILGAPTDELVTNRPGARFGPRAIRNGDYLWGSSRPAMDTGVDFFEVLTVVDHGDVEIVPGYPEPTHQTLREAVAAIRPQGRFPSSSVATTRSPIPTSARWPRAWPPSPSGSSISTPTRTMPTRNLA